jgi:hypothetical protein
MSAYASFFLNSPSSVVHLECIAISHPGFTKPYYLIRNAVGGITVTHEDLTVVTYQYYPLSITRTGASDDLSQSLKIDLGDLGQVLPQELDHVSFTNTFNVRPTLQYRVYRSDSLNAPLYGPITYQITNITFNKTSTTLEAEAPQLNTSGTGELYSLSRFPMLAGFL